MKLLMSDASPYARKARVFLLETEQSDVEVVDTKTNPLDSPAALTAANPVGKIPALLREDGPTLYDSRVITRFLDARAGADLYPEARLWETLTLEATGDAIMDAAITIVYEKRLRPEELHWPVWFDAQWAKVERALDALGARWMSHLYGPLDAGHIAVGCALGYLDLRHSDRNWRAGRDSLAAWEKGFAARPAMIETKPA
jgi:glutathione S-transferase